MNKVHLSKMEGNEMSVLLKYYMQKVLSKIKYPAPPRRDRGPDGKTGTAERKGLDEGKKPETNNPPDHRRTDAGPFKTIQAARNRNTVRSANGVPVAVHSPVSYGQVRVIFLRLVRVNTFCPFCEANAVMSDITPPKIEPGTFHVKKIRPVSD